MQALQSMQPSGSTQHLSRSFELGLVLLGMDAVGGADLEAQRIFHAVIGNYVGHDESISRMK